MFPAEGSGKRDGRGGLAAIFEGGDAHAPRLCEEAIEIAPDYARAYRSMSRACNLDCSRRRSVGATMFPYRVRGELTLEHGDPIEWWGRGSYLIDHVLVDEAKDFAKLPSSSFVGGANLDLGFLDRHEAPPFVVVAPSRP